MKLMSEKRGIARLREIREAFRLTVAAYEDRARDCGTCDTPGACCLDAHFVNVRISRFEAEAIVQAISGLSIERRSAVHARVENAIAEYRLADGATEKFACPLFERGTGCLVHSDAKPLPCIQHACYERKEDLPPDGLLDKAEELVERLSRRVYGSGSTHLPLPLAVKRSIAPE